MNGRVELHIESCFSENLSLLPFWAMANKAKENGCAAVAITDRNSVYGYADAEEYLHQRGIRMIYGITLSCVDEEDRYDVVLLAKNLAGRDNIFQLVELLHENLPVFGRAVTRKQLDAHRDGTLMGAAARNGQIVRAVEHRRNEQYLERIASDYDYIEFLPEPYDVSAEVYRLARRHHIPLCAVQLPTLGDGRDMAEYHAFCALNEYYLDDGKPEYWKSAAELEEEIATLYVLPQEEGAAQETVFDAPRKIAEQIEPMPTIRSFLEAGQERLHEEALPALRRAAEATLRERFGEDCPAPVRERVEQELTLIDARGAASIFLYLSTLAEDAKNGKMFMMVAGGAANSELLHLWGLSAPDPMPRHIWCPACGNWETTALPVGTQTKCPKCGRPVTADGVSLPVESLPDPEADAPCIEIRCSEKTKTRCQKRFGDAKNAWVMQVQRGLRQMRWSKAENSRIADAYLQKHPAAAETLRDSWLFWYHIDVARERQWEQEGEILEWSFYPASNWEILCHLPAYQMGKKIRCALFSRAPERTVPRIQAVQSTMLDLLELCAASTGIPAAQVPMHEQEVYGAIRAMAENEAEDGSLVERICRLLDLSPYHSGERELPQGFVATLFKMMPLRGYEDLYRMISLSCGTGVWQENARELLKQGKITPEQVIVCQEDVLDYLTRRGCGCEMALKIMKHVRQGKALVSSIRPPEESFTPQQWEALRACGAEDWFLESCRKIAYLFLRGHCAAVADGFAHLVWYALHAPEETERVLAEAGKK